MVGLLGQTIDWTGEDNGWYCLLSDGPDFQINLRLSAPMKEAFPDRQLVSAVSLLTGDGHSLVIEVEDPYSTETDGCPEEWSVPCLAEGGVRILVDGEASGAMQSPGDSVHLPGGVAVSAANLMPECRPFGGDRIWASQFEEMTAGRRSLRATTPALSFSEWVLEGDTLAAPTWCAKRLEDDGPAGLFSASSNHMTVRLETEVATIRVNVGVNYQDLETGPDGTVLVPELEFWQTDLGFDGLYYSEMVAGLLGDTARFVFDDERLPVTAGLDALHAPVESYRVDGPFGRVFDKMLQ